MYAQTIRESLTRLDTAATVAAIQSPERLRAGLVTALAFAKFSIHCAVPVAERETLRYIQYRIPPATLATSRAETLLAADRILTPEYAATLYRIGPLHAVASLTSDLPGIGPAKAAFTLALAGFYPLACVDRWIARRYQVPDKVLGRIAKGTGITRAALYMSLLRDLYPDPDSRYAQWLDFADDVPSFRESLHLPVIDLVLGAYAGTVVPPLAVSVWG